MKITNVIVFGAILLVGIAAWAQEYPKVEVGADYAYLRFAPSGPYTKGHSLNGGGGSVVYNFNEYLGIKMDLQGFTSSVTGFNIPAGNPIFQNGLVGNVQGNMFTYLFGPQIKFRTHKFQPFGQALFGGAHTNVYSNAFKQLCINPGDCSITKAPTTQAFAMEFGGGVDIPINNIVSFRPAEIDYLMTRFSNAFTGTSNQNNFRYSAGVVFTFGGTTHH